MTKKLRNSILSSIAAIIVGVAFAAVALSVGPQAQQLGGTATSTVFTNGQLIGQGPASYNGITVGTGLSLTSGTLSATGGSSSTTTINGLSAINYTFTGSGVTIATSAPGTVNFTVTGGSGGGLGTTTPFTTGYIPEATGTNVTLSNSNIFQTTAGLINIGTTTGTSTFTLQGSGGTNPLTIASSTGTSLLTVAQNGSTTISSLGAGLVQSTSGGSLFVTATPLARSLGGTANTSFATNGIVTASASTLTNSSALNFNPVSGLMGINTTTPGSILSIVDNAGSVPYLTIASSSNNSVYFIVTQAGNVGIGTTTPANPLDIAGVSPLRLERSGTGAYVYTLIGGAVGSDTADLAVDPQQANSGFIFRPRNASNVAVNGLAIDLNGNVGIGTTTPGASLVVVGTTIFRATTSSASSFQFQNASGVSVLSIDTSSNAIVTNNIKNGTNNLIIGGIALAGVGGNSIIFGSNGANITNTSGVGNLIQVGTSFGNFAPTSGTGVYNTINLGESINQIGNSNGISRSILLNPTLTSTFDYRNFETAAITNNLSTSTNPISTAYNVLFNPITYQTASTTAYVIATSSTLNIAGAPVASTTSLSLTNSIGLWISGNNVTASTTNAYGAYISAPTGATNNYAAVFTGGNVGIGTTTPAANLVLQNAAGTSDAFRIASSTGASIAIFGPNGSLTLGTASTSSGSLILQNSANGFTTTLRPSTSVASNLVLTLPATTGTAGQVLTTDGAGGLYFSTAGGSGVTSINGDTTAAQTFATSSDSILGSNIITSGGRTVVTIPNPFNTAPARMSMHLVGGTLYNNFGFSAPSSFPGSTLSANDSNLGAFVQYATSTSGGVAGFDIGSATRVDWLPDMSFHVMPGATSTNVIYWIGLGSGFAISSNLATDTPAFNTAAFRFASNVDGTNFWRAVTKGGGGSNTTITTTAPFATSTPVLLRIRFVSTSEVDFYVNNVVVASSTTNIPTSGTTLHAAAAASPITSGTQSINAGWITDVDNLFP